jgi:hypothetical protein
VGRRLTIGEARWPETPEFSAVAARWNRNVSTIMLGFVWEGYDLLCSEVLSEVDVTTADEQLERSITQLLVPRIRRQMSGNEPYFVDREVDEMETRHSPQAKPPCYDIAFVLTSNERIMWPLEAKVLRTDGDVARYVNEITTNFLTCRYGPFSREGAMLGYLLAGSPINAFTAIGQKVPCQLNAHPDFVPRYHKGSFHQRVVPADKSYPQFFTCHHLIMELSSHTIA